MSKKEPKLIDGFSSVQAIKRSGKSPQADPKLKHSSTRLPQAEAPPPPTAPPGPGAPKAQHTAVPIKHELVCYECGYGFVVSGKIHYALCPRCKREFDIADHTVSDHLTADLRTMGCVELKPEATLGAVTIVAQNIIVATDATRAMLRATRRLELAPGGALNLGTATVKEFVIRAGATFTCADALICPIVDIAGTLRANIRAEDRVRIRATGNFRGDLYSPRLQVEDGATIKASIFLGRGVAPAAREAQHAA